MTADPMRPGPATPDADTLRGLIERVRAAKGPDRDLNVALAVELTGWCRHEHTTRSGWQDDTGYTCDACGADSWGNKSVSGQGLHDGCPAYTASLDAALALVERVLPGADYEVRRVSGRIFGKVRFAPLASAEDECPTAPLAILAALLTALLAQTEGAPDAER